MSCKADLVKGFQVTDVPVAGIGVGVDLSTLFPAGQQKLFNVITVYNNTNRAVKVSYMNDTGGITSDFIIPNGGSSFTHELAIGFIVPASLKFYSIDATIATGVVTVNVSKNH